MKTRNGIFLILLMALMLAGCGPAKPTFEISGSPNPLYYGCGASVFTFNVTGPGAGLRINSIIVGYQLFDGKGSKIIETTATLHPIPDAAPVAYDADRIIPVPDSAGSAPATDEPIIDFGEGRLDFAATVYATYLSPPPSGPAETYYFTSTKSVPVLPCSSRSTAPAPTVDPGLPSFEGTIIPPGSSDKPKPGGSGSPPSCSAEPNNPNCVPGP
jgi:hypothetical protein